MDRHLLFFVAVCAAVSLASSAVRGGTMRNLYVSDRRDKTAGGNCVATYVPWCIHEEKEGDIRFGDHPVFLQKVRPYFHSEILSVPFGSKCK